MNNERLKILVDALVKMSELWKNTNSSDGKHSIYSQIDFLRKKITAELKK